MAATWAQVVAANRQPNAGLVLSDKPELRSVRSVPMESGVWERAIRAWEFTLVGRIMGLKPNIAKMQGFVRQKWGEQDHVRVSARPNGIFLFTFNSKSDMLDVLMGGPWFFENRPLMLKEWSPSMDTNDMFAEEVTVWVKLPGLEPIFWDAEPLSYIGSVIGKPICTDAITASKYRMDYARVCIEISPKFPPVYQVDIVGPEGQVFSQPIIYEWLPPRCEECLTFSHNERSCPLKEPRKNVTNKEIPSKMVWKPKNLRANGEVSVTKVGVAEGRLAAADSSKPQVTIQRQNVVQETQDHTVTTMQNSEIVQVSEQENAQQNQMEIEIEEAKTPTTPINSNLGIAYTTQGSSLAGKENKRLRYRLNKMTRKKTEQKKFEEAIQEVLSKTSPPAPGTAPTTRDGTMSPASKVPPDIPVSK